MRALTSCLGMLVRAFSLEQLGYGVGYRILELSCYREKHSKRELKLIGMLQFVSSVLWKQLFGKQADSLERSVEADDECEHCIEEA